MKARHKVQAKQIRLGKGVAIGAVIALIISLLCAACIALLTVNGQVSERATVYFTHGTQLISVLAATLIAARLVGDKYALVCGATAAVYGFVLVGMNVFFFEGNFRNLLVSMLMLLLGTVASCALCIRRGSGKRRRKTYSR